MLSLAQSNPFLIPSGTAAHSAGPQVAPELAREITALQDQARALSDRAAELAAHAGIGPAATTRLDIFHSYMGVLIVAFLITLLVTPVMRGLAIRHGVVDRPKEARKVHRIPIAYLGGVGVYLGILGAVFFAYATPFHGLVELHPSAKRPDELAAILPLSVLIGMTVIMLCGLIDDVVGLDPRLKIVGILFASAALAATDVGVKVAAGLLVPIAHSLGIPVSPIPGGETILIHLPGPIPDIDVVYWIGTGVIAFFVLGATNASNLIDGLDGLLSGVTAIANAGLLVIALTLAVMDDGPRDSSRLILCLAVLGACLGFLPHNFNPANIFLGDTGSLLLGYCTIVVILMLGDTGKTHLVLAGLVIYAIPIIDTSLAIIRRKVSGKRISDADDQHLHHMLKRALGVKGAVLTLYAIGGSFALLGVLMSEGRQRVIYALAMIVAAFIGVTAFKIARKSAIEAAMAAAEAERERRAQADLLGEASASVRVAPSVAASPAAAPSPAPSPAAPAPATQTA